MWQRSRQRLTLVSSGAVIHASPIRYRKITERHLSSPTALTYLEKSETGFEKIMLKQKARP